MSASTARASRRDLRRALGPTVADALVHLEQQIADQSAALRTLATLARRQERLSAGSVWDRLRWMVTGRA